jgi:hypothetical protein
MLYVATLSRKKIIRSGKVPSNVLFGIALVLILAAKFVVPDTLWSPSSEGGRTGVEINLANFKILLVLVAILIGANALWRLGCSQKIEDPEFRSRPRISGSRNDVDRVG